MRRHGGNVRRIAFRNMRKGGSYVAPNDVRLARHIAMMRALRQDRDEGTEQKQEPKGEK